MGSPEDELLSHISSDADEDELEQDNRTGSKRAWSLSVLILVVVSACFIAGMSAHRLGSRKTLDVFKAKASIQAPEGMVALHDIYMRVSKNISNADLYQVANDIKTYSQGFGMTPEQYLTAWSFVRDHAP